MVTRALSIVGFCMAALASPAMAVSTNGTATVRITIPSSCEIKLADQVPLDFGQSASLATNIDAVGTIKLLCSTNVSSTVFANNGDNFLSDRRMKNTASTSYIRYGLFSNSGRTTAFPTAAGSNPLTGNGQLQDVTVYGRIYGSQTAPVGDYADTLLITLTW